MRGATLVDARDDVLALISTRAPLAGSDTPSSTASRSRFDFNPRSPCGERRRPPWFRRPTVCYFNPRSPCGERRTPSATSATAATISIRAPLAGSDASSRPVRGTSYIFQSALPLRGATAAHDPSPLTSSFQSALPLRGATGDDAPPSPLRKLFQSALPLRGATAVAECKVVGEKFQSALPLRGATGTRSASCAHSFDFNPRSPCGERHPGATMWRRRWDFNPRSPCGERPVRYCSPSGLSRFQSALPLRGATTLECFWPSVSQLISIRAPLAGSDSSFLSICRLRRHFNPRSPCGERPERDTEFMAEQVIFQSALPLRGATGTTLQDTSASQYFNPRSPCGERRSTTTNPLWWKDFNPRSPCGERLLVGLANNADLVFQSALPLRGATALER